jgi:hypothetical protein
MSTSDYLLEERKSYTYQDFVDEQIDGFSVVSNSTTSVVLNSVAGITVGDLLYESSTVYSPILSINDATNTVVVNDSLTWAVAAVTVLKGIDCNIEWSPQYCDNSGIQKAFAELIIMFKNERFKGATMDFYTDLNSGFETVAINGDYSGGDWGLFLWGSVPWGGVSKNKLLRCSVPRNKSRGQYLGVRFSCRMAYSQFSVEGLSLTFDYVSERQGERL